MKARRQQEVKCEPKVDGTVLVWADRKVRRRLKRVAALHIIEDFGPFSSVCVDPRYKLIDVVKEIESLA